MVVIAVLLLLADRIPARLKWWLTPPTLRKASGLTKPEPWTSRRERELLELLRAGETLPPATRRAGEPPETPREPGPRDGGLAPALGHPRALPAAEPLG